MTNQNSLKVPEEEKEDGDNADHQANAHNDSHQTEQGRGGIETANNQKVISENKETNDKDAGD